MSAGGSEGLRADDLVTIITALELAVEIDLEEYPDTAPVLDRIRALLAAQSGPEVGGEVCSCDRVAPEPGRHFGGLAVRDECPIHGTGDHDPTPAEPRGDAAGLEAVLAGHRLHASMNICTCRDWRAVANTGSMADQHDAHLAAVIVEAGWKR